MGTRPKRQGFSDGGSESSAAKAVAIALIVLLGCDQSEPPDAAPSPLVWAEAAPCPAERFEAMGAATSAGLLVLGGFSSGTLAVTRRVDRFDGAQWTQLADLPGAQTHSGVAVDGDVLYLAGGFIGTGDWTTTAEVWRYQADSWSAAQPLPEPRAGLVLVRRGRILHAVGGLAHNGQSDTGAHQTLNLDAATPAWTDRAPLPNPRNHLGGALISDRVHVVGGRHGWNENTGNQTSHHAFSADAWTELAPIPVGRCEIADATLAAPDGSLLVIGGSTEGVKPSEHVWRYDPQADEWAALTALPGPRKGAVAGFVNGALLVTTGSPTGTDPIDTTFTATW